MIHDVLALGVPFSVALLLAALGENFNQRAGVFNLGCEGIMSVGAFLGFLPPYLLARSALAPYANTMGFALAAAAGVLLGLLFALVTVTFRASQGIAGIGLQMLGWGVAGTIFRHFIGGVVGIPGVAAWPVPGLSRIPFLGDILFHHDPVVYLAFLAVPASAWLLYRTPWGLARPGGGHAPPRRRHHGHERGPGALPGAHARRRHGRAGRGLPLALPGEDVRRRSRWPGAASSRWPWSTSGAGRRSGILGGALLFSLAQALQLAIQVAGIKFPYEFAVMLPYVLVILVLALARRSRKLGPAALGKPYDREMRV